MFVANDNGKIGLEKDYLSLLQNSKFVIEFFLVTGKNVSNGIRNFTFQTDGGKNFILGGWHYEDWHVKSTF